MKKILVMAAIILTGTYVFFAGENIHAKSATEKVKQGENMKFAGNPLGRYSQLNLTEEQKTKINQIFEESRIQMKSIAEDTSLDTAQKRIKSREIMQTTQKQADAVLTPEQKNQLDQMRAQKHEKMKKQKRENTQQKRGNAKETIK